MRLEILNNPRGPLHSAVKAGLKVAVGRVPDAANVFLYRREFYGRWMSVCVTKVMNRTRAWSKGDVELFAAFVSSLNGCRF